MTYQREGAWKDDPVQAQELCEILHRSHPEVMKDLEKRAILETVPRPHDVLSAQTTLAYEDGYENGYGDGYRAGEREQSDKIKKVLYPG